tara:strand:+ start:174 stop:350 length:177 start_codon:yes stop_codon:yes gene_type:complete
MKVILTKLPQDGREGMYLLTLFKNARPIKSKSVEGLGKALIEGKKLAKKENADYEQRL